MLRPSHLYQVTLSQVELAIHYGNTNSQQTAEVHFRQWRQRSPAEVHFGQLKCTFASWSFRCRLFVRREWRLPVHTAVLAVGHIFANKMKYVIKYNKRFINAHNSYVCRFTDRSICLVSRKWHVIGSDWLALRYILYTIVMKWGNYREQWQKEPGSSLKALWTFSIRHRCGRFRHRHVLQRNMSKKYIVFYSWSHAMQSEQWHRNSTVTAVLLESLRSFRLELPKDPRTLVRTFFLTFL